MKAGQQQVGRLAMREEGNYWNAYYAMNDTMEGAVHLGSIKMNLVRQSAAVRDSFMALMRAALGNVLNGATGAPVIWNEPEKAPEHERAGKA